MKMKPDLRPLVAAAGILVLTALLMTGCSTHPDPGYSGHHPPRKSPSGKVPATQKPYRIKGKQYVPIASAHGFVQTGTASWYGRKFHGRKTSNGETYNMYAMTAAHKTLPMNTWVMVHNLENNHRIKVRINDRGPFVRGRIIDLSYTGAKKIGIVGPGTARVRVTALGRATSFSKKTKDPVKFKPVDYWKGNFSVQVGAFKSRANAEKFRARLSASYVNAHMVTYEDYRGVFYRVRIGRFSNLNQARRFGERIVAQGLFDRAFAVGE